MSLSSKVAIISGGTRGIGRVIALKLASEGARVSFNYLKSDADALALEREIAGIGGAAKAFKADIRDFDAVRAWVDATKDAFSTIDIVVNNAGIIKDKALAMMDVSDWNDVIGTNLGGVFHLSKACLVTLMKQRSGVIVNISSVSGIAGIARQTNYSASKAGIIGFTKALAREVSAFNIRVNAVAPGFIETDMIRDIPAEHKKSALGMIPLGKFGTAEDVAEAVNFLVSDASKYITGQTVIVDGGMYMA